MANTSATPDDRIECPACDHAFNGLRASWCGCLTEDRSLVCPRCSKCFCSQSAEWKREFWARSSPQLKAKRREANQTEFSPPKFLLRDELTRPLVLIAEDNKLIHLLASKMIHAMGYGVVGATDGKEAIELCRIYEPDLVLTDALMPVMDGREVCERIKNDPILKGTPVVLMSSVYKDHAYAREAKIRFKADEYLTKPVNADQLSAVFRRLIGSPRRKS